MEGFSEVTLLLRAEGWMVVTKWVGEEEEESEGERERRGQTPEAHDKELKMILRVKGSWGMILMMMENTFPGVTAEADR